MDTTTEAVEDHLNAAMLNEVEYGVTVDLLRALAVERDTLAAKLAELRPTEGAPDEAETFACTLDSRGTPWASGCASLMRQMASELRGYRKAVTWGVDTVAEAYRLDAEKLRDELADLQQTNRSMNEQVGTLEARVFALEERDAAATEYTFAPSDDPPNRFQAIDGSWGDKDRWFTHDVERGRDIDIGLTKEVAISKAKALAAGEVK